MHAMEVLSPLLEFERVDRRAGEMDQGAITHVLDLAKSLLCPSVFQWCVRWQPHCNCTTRILRVLCGYFEHQRRVQVRGCVAEPVKTMKAIVTGSKWSCKIPEVRWRRFFTP